MKAIVIREYGSADVLAVSEQTAPELNSNDVLVQQNAVGINFHDIYVRSGLYKTLPLPGIPGCEASGTVLDIGSHVKDVAVGDRVAYVTGPPYGAYASHRAIAEHYLVPVPDTLGDEVVAASLLRALTVEMLVSEVGMAKKGMSVLVHAAAGGVGRLLCQRLSNMGVTVLGTVGSEHKERIATACGCTHTVNYRDTDVANAVKDITNKRGVNIVFDSIGADTFAGSLDALGLCGHLVQFGQSSGPVDPVTLQQLAEKSTTLSRPILFHYLTNTEKYRALAHSVMQQLLEGKLKVDAADTFSLAETKKAHTLLESGNAVRPIVVIP